jgi:L-alanine-DL-glutamate epimerase-like enolase superfamily enzyme
VRIDAIDVRPVVMPKQDPSWRFALAASPETCGFLVTIRTDAGTEGIGYTGATAHTGSGVDVVGSDLRALAERLAGEAVPRPADLDALPGGNHAKAGIDIALHDLLARDLGVPLHRLFGDAVREEVSILRILALKAPGDVARSARALVAEGYSHLKIKLDGDGETDVARVRAVRDAVGSEVHLTVDANQSYRPDDAIRVARRMEELGVELFEQPVARGDLEGLARVAAAVDVPVEADESALGLEDVRRLIAMRAVDSISLKIPKLGGLAKTREAAELCAAAGVRCRIGATVGSRILAAAALHLAAATPAIGEPCELAEFARLLGDPAEGLEVERGRLRVPHGVGLGVHLRAPVRA